MLIISKETLIIQQKNIVDDFGRRVLKSLTAVFFSTSSAVDLLLADAQTIIHSVGSQYISIFMVRVSFLYLMNKYYNHIAVFVFFFSPIMVSC